MLLLKLKTYLLSNLDNSQYHNTKLCSITKTQLMKKQEIIPFENMTFIIDLRNI